MKLFRPAKTRVEVSVGESVRILRELQELSQSQLAERSGIPQSTISAIENGRVNLGIERAKMLARALQCHPSVLVFPGWEVPLKLAAERVIPRAQHPTRLAGVPGGCGGSERRIRACYNAGRASQRIRARSEERRVGKECA